VRFFLVDGLAPRSQLLPVEAGRDLFEAHLQRHADPDVARLDALRADPATCDLTVIALSASAMPELVMQAHAHGAADYWTKPLDFDRFLADMQRLLAARRR